MKEKSTVILGTLLAFGGIALLASCGGGSGGDTDGGTSLGDAGTGTQYIADGASGSKMTIELEDATQIPTAGRVGFLVGAKDPNGNPLSYIRVNCETEHGISIIEPSRGGVAFETTNQNGYFSGVLGGLTPGSYMIECRGPQGYNLVARKHYKVVGEIPEGFAGFPGAAGGNLGGGTIIDPPDANGEDNVSLTEITFTSVVGDEGRTGEIDNSFIPDCDGDPTTRDPEPFGVDNYSLAVVNLNEQRVFIQSIEYEIDLGTSKVTSLEQLGGLVVQGGASVSLEGVFTQNVAQSGATTASKYFTGTSIPTPSGTFNVTFTVVLVDSNGETQTIEQSAAIVIQGFNNC